METVWSKKADEILKVGIWLGDKLDTNWALTKLQALNALDQFFDSQIAILGGDVYDYKDGICTFNSASWYCDKLPGETEMEYLKRSIDKSRSYIEQYPIGNIGQVFFGFVPEV